MATDTKTLTLKTLSKGNVWELQENDIFRLWEMAERDADIRENTSHYITIIKSAFEVEEIKVDKPEVVNKYISRGMTVGTLKTAEGERSKWAIKKRTISRVTDLTYENIHHISASKLLEVIDRNFGGGWDSLSQSIQDIIESGFDISTTTLPKDRLHKPGGLYEQKLNDGFLVLEIAKGTWVEAIFAKEKPMALKPKMAFGASAASDDDLEDMDDIEEEDETDDYYKSDDDDDEYDEDRLTEESYRTTFDEDPEQLDLAAEEIGDDYDD